MPQLKIGRSNVEIEAEGCICCGTRWSSGWKVAREVPVKIGKREFTLELHICADCQKKEKQPALF